MKKVLTSVLALALLVSSLCLVSCDSKEESGKDTDTKPAESTSSTEAVETKAPETKPLETVPVETQAPETEAPTVEGASLTSLVDIASVASANEYYGEEAPENLFDQSELTKWCLNFYSDNYPIVTFKTTKAVKVNGFEFWTAGDTADWPGRNPLHVILSGSNDDGATWTVIADRDVELESENCVASEVFAVTENSGSYTMFKLEVTEIVGFDALDILQISQFNLIGVEA